MAPTEDVFTAEVKNRHDQMIGELESINVDALKSEGLRISLGGKTFKFTELEVIADEAVEDRIRNEFKDKLNRQQQRIREKINDKINQLLVMHQQKQRELDRKEEQMKRKYAESAMMPDLNESHLGRGLSVVKGRSGNELLWVYRATYNPRFIIYYPESRVSNHNRLKKPIPSRLVNRMKQDMLIIIRTKDKQIRSIATRNLKGNGSSLIPFPHYHQQTSQDCWGNWDYNRNWNTPDDIILLAKEAESILETINQGSLAEHNPVGLPRIATIIKAVEDVDPVDESIIKATSEKRKRNETGDEDIWSSL